MDYIFITNSEDLAAFAQDSGATRIMVDLEVMGKVARQGHLDTVISNHTVSDAYKIKSVLTNASLQVRVNPIHSGSKSEIDRVVEAGAELVMLPMFTTKQEVEEFVSYVDGRAQTVLLLETSQALVRIDEIVNVLGVDEIHLGLNDLHLSMGLDFMFELLSGGIVDYLASKVRNKDIRFGFGGIARFGEGAIDPKLVLSEHVRLGSTVAILSRSFHGNATSVQAIENSIDLPKEISLVNNYLAEASRFDLAKLDSNRVTLRDQVLNFVEKRRSSDSSQAVSS